MNRQLAIDRLKDILKIDTVNPPGNEELVAKELKTLLEKFGIECQLVPYSEGRMNLIAYLKGKGKTGKRRVLGLSGHMDVVPPGDVEWRYDPFEANEVDGKIYARGACDMKSGLMSCIMAVISLKENQATLDGDVKLLVTVGEEAGAVGAKQLVEEGYADDLDALIIAEPTNSEIVVTHKGALWTQITTHGKTTHGSRPDTGINAVLHMHEIIKGILSDDFQFKFESDAILDAPTYSLNVIKGGSNTNVVPDQCQLNIDFRTVPLQNHQDIINQLYQVIEKAKQRYSNLNAEIEILNDLAPMQTAKVDPFVQQLQEVYENETGIIAKPTGMTGYTDGSQFMKAEKDFPIVIWSTIEGDTAHQPNEYVDIEKYLKGISFFQTIAQSYLNEKKQV